MSERLPQLLAMGRAARAAAPLLASAGRARKDTALRAAAAAVRSSADTLLAANASDLADARAAGLGPALLDRLALDATRLDGLAAALEAIAALPDPVGRTLAEWTRPNGLRIARVAVPLGVVAVIYESRPNVTLDAGALCLKAGNPCVLRGGSESLRTNLALHEALVRGLEEAGLPAACIQFVATRDRAAVGHLLADMRGLVDVIVPRGGRSLVARIQQEARVPVIGHLEGNCHVYVDGAADLSMALEVVRNAKLRRTGVCGAAETLLVDRACAATHLPALVADLLAAGCELRGDAETRALDARVQVATEADWDTEYLDAILAVRVVAGVEEAIAHIARHGSAHTESIITSDPAVAERFLAAVDSAIVLHNASTQFADGGEFGMGAEIGISTDRLHARGPVGLEQLTSYKYVVRGTGQTRP